MRFFSGMGGGDKKKTVASSLFREKMGGLAQGANFKKKLDEKVQQYIDDYQKNREKLNNRMGKYDETPKELSKSVKTMLTILAQKSLQKEIKLQKKKEYEQERAKKNKIREAEQVKAREQYQREIKVREETAAKTSAKSYFFGYTDE